MGNQVCLPTEDTGVNLASKMAVSANSNSLNDDALNAALNMNPLSSLKQKIGLTFSL